MSFNFIPLQEQQEEILVPYIEDAVGKSDTVPYYSSTLTVDRAKKDVISVLGLLHATGYFEEGDFQIGKHKRRGYILHFTLGTAPGRIMVAGLPIYKVTPNKLDQVRVQALLNLRDWLRNAITQQIFTPGANPLVPFLLLPDGIDTITEAMIRGNHMPTLLPPPR